MSKCKIALLAGVLLSLLVFTGCPSPVDPDADKAKVTFKFGSYAVEATSGESTFTQKFPKSTKISWPDLIIKSDYKGQVAIKYWEVEETKEAFDFNNTVIESDITLVAKYAAVNVLNLAAKQINENSILVTWDYVNNSNYEITYKEKNGNSITPENIENGHFTISGISLNEEYTITAKRTSTLTDVNNSDIIPITITVTASGYNKHTQWLMLMYMDGDNNLNDPIYLDLNEAEYGLSKLPAESSLRIIALWDGWDFETNNEDGLTSFLDYFPAQYTTNTSSTKLLELGADSNQLYATNGGISYKACRLSPSTIDLTSTVDWIENNEVNMSNEETLKNFLKWAKANYTADKIILQFSNHGGGPRSAANGEKYGRRSMCWDETSGGKDFLKTSDVSKALEAADLKDKNSNTISLIMEDVCLGGSLEEAYELKDYAKYYVGSPNNVPGSGFDYISFVSSLTNGATVEEVGCNLVKTYKSNYTWTDTKWNSYLTDNPGLANESNMWVSISNPNANTLSFIKLSEIEDVKTAVNALADLINKDNEEEPRIAIGSNNKYYYANNNIYYDYYGYPLPSDVTLVSYENRKYGIKYWTACYGDPIYYDGTFGCLKDLGAMCAFMRQYYPQSLWPELNTKTKAVTSALSNAIVASWRDGYNAPTYYKNTVENEYQDALGGSSFNDDLGAGLTINCSCWINHQASDGKTYKYQEFADWYKNELSFGKNCENWTSLIESWWPTRSSY